MTIYRGVGGVNREIKQQFRGISGVNREIKEQYRSVGGVNRKVFKKWAGELYDAGNTYIDKTGGWGLYYVRHSEVGSLALDTSYMTLVSNWYSSGSDGNEIEIGTANKVDVTAFNSLSVTFDAVVQSGRTDFGFALLNSKDVGAGTTIAKITPVKLAYISDNTTVRTITMILDISAITGQYYLGFESYAALNSQSTIYIKTIKLS
ncbi:hypothetical protein [Aminipila terrae]|uniref:Uncharacterized protein n=1 Tax=Aminipila terrae TaxID=2697030 RepID=A0A6P1MKC1_9FIRM|nr:hypothetical protein [Aminipila terrae]QHI71455.1 hypothetical protein Ami3637_02840 [Aminipila terrae]